MAEEKESRSKAVLGGKKKSKKKGGKKKGGKHVHEMHIRHGKKGGYIVKHDFQPETGEEPAPSDEYPVQDMDDLHDHLDEHMQPPQEPDGDEGAPAPAAPAAPPAGAPPQGM